MNLCPACLHHELAQLTPAAGGGSVDMCYRPELLIDGGGSSCSVNRGAGGGCEGGRYFEEKEKTSASV